MNENTNIDFCRHIKTKIKINFTHFQADKYCLTNYQKNKTKLV